MKVLLSIFIGLVAIFSAPSHSHSNANSETLDAKKFVDNLKAFANHIESLNDRVKKYEQYTSNGSIDWSKLAKIKTQKWQEIIADDDGRLFVELIFSNKECEVQTIKNIFDAGLPIDFKPPLSKSNLLAISLAFYNHEKKAKCIEEILKRGADPNEKYYAKSGDFYYYTYFNSLLMSSPYPGSKLTKHYIKAMKLLCEYGADLSLLDGNQYSGWDTVDRFGIDRNLFKRCLENEKAP